ncbi:hypothetical protein DESC_810117 [Desulfosarcina cetonica]|nr:hypothetical protein DESC_810117 [Desulfosarcina cetonica]
MSDKKNLCHSSPFFDCFSHCIQTDTPPHMPSQNERRQAFSHSDNIKYIIISVYLF